MIGRRRGLSYLVFLLLIATASGLPVPASLQAQSCPSFIPCRGPGTCVDGSCSNPPVDGGSCDDQNPCTRNDTCAFGSCRGEPVTNGTSCNDGCGQCVAGFCLPAQGRDGQPCTDQLGACTTNDRCQFNFCLGDFVSCPDSDNNRCTYEFCDSAVGACVTLADVVCAGPCTECVAPSGECRARNEGGACDDFNVCTGAGVCRGGECDGGDPIGPRDCVGDCDGDAMVNDAEILVALEDALDGSEPSCASTEVTADGQVTVEEVLSAVAAKIFTCV